MYYCEECKRWFDTPSSYQECVGEFWGAPAYEYFDMCPYCHSDYILTEEDYNNEYGEESEEE